MRKTNKRKTTKRKSKKGSRKRYSKKTSKFLRGGAPLEKFDLLLIKRDKYTGGIITRDLIPNYEYESFYKFLQYLNTPEMQSTGVEYYIRPHNKKKAMKSLPSNIFDIPKEVTFGLYPEPVNNRVGQGTLLVYKLKQHREQKLESESHREKL